MGYIVTDEPMPPANGWRQAGGRGDLGSPIVYSGLKYDFVYGHNYCLPWNGRRHVPAGSESESECKAMCSMTSECSAITFYQELGCYLFESCSTTRVSTSQGQVYKKRSP